MGLKLKFSDNLIILMQTKMISIKFNFEYQFNEYSE